MTSTILFASIMIEVLGPCSKYPLFQTALPVERESSIWKLTQMAFNHHNIPYSGAEYGLQSAFNTPTGLDAMEVINDREMRSYGWCYEVDGKVPEVYLSKRIR
jgi:hypothetical protein